MKTGGRPNSKIPSLFDHRVRNPSTIESNYHEDFELTLRLYEKGYKVLYTPYIQAPAEAASTVKRLIRQRMRWAEGHSFNVRKMFHQLMLSPNLTRAEKFEFLYLTPYYLQAFFFILGTLSWFTSEIIFKTRLPFWTEVWGWSMVMTNLFALPLMNMVGMFMENTDERDYLGLFSFIFLSYIIAPFQAFAAVKGFMENEEGPWFRTPKTGRITDNFVPGRFIRFVKGMFGSPSLSPVTQAQAFSINPYLALSPANGEFLTRPNRYPWRVGSLLAVFLIATIFLNYFTFVMPKQALATGGNPTIEQQINIIDQATSNPSQATGIVQIDTLKYTGATYSFEVVAAVTTGTGTVNLTYNSGNNTLQIGNITALTWTRYRSGFGASPPTGAQDAYVSAVGANTTVQVARIIIVQTNTTMLTNTETQVEVGNNETTTNTSDVMLASPKFFKYGGTGKYDGTVTAYFEATLANGGAYKTTVDLVSGTANCSTVVGSVNVTGTTWTRVRTGSPITLDASGATTYSVCFNTAAGGTAKIANAKVIIDQNAPGGITKLETYHQFVNTGQTYTASEGDIGTFSTTNQGQLPQTMQDVATLIIPTGGNYYLYIIGGSTDGSIGSTTVYKAPINALGDIGTFSTTNQTQLPQALWRQTAQTLNYSGTNYIYVLGGNVSGTVKTTVYKATVNSTTGDIGTFATTNQGQLPLARWKHMSGALNVGGTNYVYVVGGNDGTNTVNTVYKATVNSGGDIGTFSTTNQGQLPLNRRSGGFQEVTINGTSYVYQLAGYDGSVQTSTVYKATVNSSGDIGTFSTTNQGQYPGVVDHEGTAIVNFNGNNYIYGIGGNGYTDVYKAAINASGDIGTLSTTNQGQLPVGLSDIQFGTPTVTLGNKTYVYVIGGWSGAGTVNTVYKAPIYTAYNAFGYNNLFEAGNWAGGTFNYYLETTAKGNTANGSVELTPGTALGQITGVGTSSFSLNRSSALTPVDMTEYDSEIQTATANNAWLVIDVTNLQVPENLLLFIPLLFFLPKIMESIKKRQKLRLAIQQSLW